MNQAESTLSEPSSKGYTVYVFDDKGIRIEEERFASFDGAMAFASQKDAEGYDIWLRDNRNNS